MDLPMSSASLRAEESESQIGQSKPRYVTYRKWHEVHGNSGSKRTAKRIFEAWEIGAGVRDDFSKDHASARQPANQARQS